MHAFQLKDVLVAITVEIDEGRHVQGQRRAFQDHGRNVVFEIVVAIDQDARVLRRDHGGELLLGEVREVHIDRAFDMAAVIQRGFIARLMMWSIDTIVTDFKPIQPATRHWSHGLKNSRFRI